MNTATVTDPDLAASKRDSAGLLDHSNRLDHSTDRVGESVGRAAAVVAGIVGSTGK